MPTVSFQSPSFKADMVFMRPQEDNTDKCHQLSLSVEEAEDDDNDTCTCGNQFAHQDWTGQCHQNLPVKCRHFLESVDCIAGTAEHGATSRAENESATVPSSVQGESKEDGENSMDIESDNPVEPDIVESVEPPIVEQTAVSTVAGPSHDRRFTRATLHEPHIKGKNIVSWAKKVALAKNAQKSTKKRRVYLNLIGSNNVKICLSGEEGVQFFINL